MENPLEPNGNSPVPPPAPDIAPAGGGDAKTPPSLTRLRTFKDDIAGAVQGSNLSAARIFLAEEERRRQRESREVAASPEAPKNRFLLVSSFFLIVAALAGFAYFRFFYRSTPPEEIAVDVPVFIRSDKVIAIAAEDRSYRDVQDELRRTVSQAVPNREVHQIALSETREVTPDNPNVARQIASSKIFGAIGAYPPSELERSLDPEFFLGVYGSSKGPMPFIIFDTANPELARAAMLAWENTMATDLGPIFPKADGYARTTANQPARFVPWDDAVYGNRDARVLSTNTDEILLWGFGDDGYLIIASDPFILSEMASRLSRDRELH